jgi:nucleoid DNA-binding protein
MPTRDCVRRSIGVQNARKASRRPLVSLQEQRPPARWTPISLIIQEPLRSSPLSKSILIGSTTNLQTDGTSKSQVKSILEALVTVGHKKLEKGGIFLVPGFAKFVVVKKPATTARKGINPLTREPGEAGARDREGQAGEGRQGCRPHLRGLGRPYPAFRRIGRSFAQFSTRSERPNPELPCLGSGFRDLREHGLCHKREDRHEPTLQGAVSRCKISAAFKDRS